MNSKIRRYALFSFFALSCTHVQEDVSVIPYPMPRPDSLALSFLPGIVSTDTLDFNAAFSRDGQTFYFSRSTLNKKWDINFVSFDGTQWGNLRTAPFSEVEYAEADPTLGPDGNLYYISDRPHNSVDTARDFDIWFVRPTGKDRWSDPENLASVNTDSSELYVNFAANGNLYFASNREGGFGSFDIYISRLVNGSYAKPENLGPAINAAESDHDPCVTPDEQALFFTSVSRVGGMGQGDIYYSTRNIKNGHWELAQNAGPRINTITYEYCSYITPDKNYFFFSSNFDVKWIHVSYLPVSIR